LESAPAASKPGEALVELADASDAAAPLLSIDIGKKARAAMEGTGSTSLQLRPAANPSLLHRLHGPEHRSAVGFRTARRVPDATSAGDFVVAQLKTALKDRLALARGDFEQDASFSGLEELSRYADRNGDNRLTLAELEDYLRLVEAGMRAQVW